jgi:pyruvate dehydrogenase E1 component
LEALRILGERFDVRAEVWSAPSFQMLRNEARDCQRWNRLHPTEIPRVPYVTQQLGESGGPVIAVTDYLSLVADQIAPYVAAPYTALGTDGYGLSDTRAALRRHFEIDECHIVVTVLAELARAGRIEPARVRDAIADFEIDPEVLPPRLR